jgi:TPR repeat protein
MRKIPLFTGLRRSQHGAVHFYSMVTAMFGIFSTAGSACSNQHAGAVRRLLVVLFMASSVMANQAVPAAGRAASPGQMFQMALEAQSVRDYGTMLSLLREAGGQGHLQAQEMLGMVLLVGPQLYGDAVQSDRCEATAWLRMAAAQGSIVGRQQLTFVGRVLQDAAARAACERARQ